MNTKFNVGDSIWLFERDAIGRVSGVAQSAVEMIEIDDRGPRYVAKPSSCGRRSSVRESDVMATRADAVAAAHAEIDAEIARLDGVKLEIAGGAES